MSGANPWEPTRESFQPPVLQERFAELAAMSWPGQRWPHSHWLESRLQEMGKLQLAFSHSGSQRERLLSQETMERRWARLSDCPAVSGLD